jgi:organic hydroperoxide reductase OsmC/OhrA
MTEDTQLVFRVVAWWAAGRTGLAKCSSAPNAIQFASPTAFGGLEGRWTPEDLVLCAIASCFTTTFRTLADKSGFEYVDLEVETEALVSKAESEYVMTEIVIRPCLTIVSEQSRETGMCLLEKSAGLCLISRVLAARPKLVSTVKVGKAPPAQ